VPRAARAAREAVRLIEAGRCVIGIIVETLSFPTLNVRLNGETWSHL